MAEKQHVFLVGAKSLGAYGGSITGRLAMYAYYFNGFMQHPIMGQGFIKPINSALTTLLYGPYGFYYLEDVGIVGCLFTFGLVGVFLFLTFITKGMKTIISGYKDRSIFSDSVVLGVFMFLVFTMPTLFLFDYARNTYRNFMLRHVYRMKLAKTAVIYGGFEIRSPWNIHIADGAIVGDESKLDGRNGIFIGKNVNLSTGVWIWTEQHDINDPHFYSNETGGAVIVQDRVWISSRVTVLPKTKIYEGAVVAAGAVVTKNCEAYTIYGGIPAKKIGERSKKLFYEFTGRHEVFW